VGVLGEATQLEQVLADATHVREGRVDLDADEEALAANVDDCGMVKPAQLGEPVVAHPRGRPARDRTAQTLATRISPSSGAPCATGSCLKNEWRS
jgi:hypothetical protein